MVNQWSPTFWVLGPGSMEGGYLVVVFCRLGWVWFHALPGSRAYMFGASLVSVAQFLAGHRPVPDCSLGELGTLVLNDTA